VTSLNLDEQTVGQPQIKFIFSYMNKNTFKPDPYDLQAAILSCGIGMLLDRTSSSMD
jgi:hypothetical protein